MSGQRRVCSCDPGLPWPMANALCPAHGNGVAGRTLPPPYTPGPCSPACWTPQECDTCGREQSPTGRSVALEASGGYCDREHCPDRPVAVRHLWDEHDLERWRFDPEGEKQHQAECDRCRPEDDDD